jgi:2,4-dienoyl-CoA reductase-like NADH-dependent reductase (Old Yellow Enzyme family)
VGAKHDGHGGSEAQSEQRSKNSCRCVGRISHPANTAHSSQAVAPSAVRPNAKMVTSSGLRDIPEPRALRADEIPAVIQEFRHAAAAAKMAGAKEYRYMERAAISFTSSFRTTQM